ncbi:MAG: hypothetical protein KDD25_05940 [Bdellovibrionales bacterium]|nr:hypothetical protein [Bdellovibrionales bacterium]
MSVLKYINLVLAAYSLQFTTEYWGLPIFLTARYLLFVYDFNQKLNWQSSFDWKGLLGGISSLLFLAAVAFKPVTLWVDFFDYIQAITIGPILVLESRSLYLAFKK